ncbi:hypothetical protein EWB00_001132 [Schistosoma japonicum]|uniref:Uncharacterized protein n=1 Tax=Schistosoma japonicum TaxID=6182 RepID=A0A4Z2DH69_SCHJA|nr:hypothetical protein EWB00_001132 [Schistosoma japonicum]
MNDYLGPPNFNHFLKEKPQTTNQQYGFFYRKEKEKSVDIYESKPMDNNLLHDVPSSNSLRHHTKLRSLKVRPPLPRKITYHTASPLTNHRKECNFDCGRNNPDTRLTRVKGIQLWHAHTGSLVHIKP